MFEPAGEWTLDVSLGEGGASLRMIREANGWRVEKQVYVPADAEQLSVMYECTNTTDQPRAGRFVSEWNVSVPHRPDGDDRTAAMAFGNHTVDVHTEPGSIDDVHAFTLRGSAEYGVLFEIEGRADVWHFPVMSVSSSEGGLERTVQGASVSIARRLDPGPGASASLRFSVGITEL